MLFKKTTQNSGDQASWLLKLSAGAAILFLHIPLWLMFLYTFHNRRIGIHLPPPGLTLKRIPRAIANPEMQAALLLTLKVAVLATVVALILGTLAAAAVYRLTSLARRQSHSCSYCPWRCRAS